MKKKKFKPKSYSFGFRLDVKDFSKQEKKQLIELASQMGCIVTSVKKKAL